MAYETSRPVPRAPADYRHQYGDRSGGIWSLAVPAAVAALAIFAGLMAYVTVI